MQGPVFLIQDMLQGVWSVRKDVRIHKNRTKASDVGAKSFYSRHNMMTGEETYSRVESSQEYFMSIQQLGIY